MTQRKSIFWIFSILLITMAMVACAPAATQEPAPEVVETEPVAEVTDEPMPEMTHEMTEEATEMATGEATGEAAMPTSMTGAADLRVALNKLAGEHIYLTGAATDAALHGRDAEFEAAAAALDTNSVDLANAVGSVYGEDAGAAFLELWRAHIGFFVDYTTAVATNDEAMKTQALDDLHGYSEDIGAFLSGANPNLPADAVEALFNEHIDGLTMMIDAQAVDDYTTAYSAMREGYMHGAMIGDTLAVAIVMQFPEMFPGEAQSSAADLRVALNNLAGEHIYLTNAATGAALGGRTPQFEAAAAALDENSMALSGAVGSVYGEEAGAAFLELWRAHIGFFVDYTAAVASGDEAMKTQALDDLHGYSEDIGAFLSGANPNLPADAVEGLFNHHIDHLTMMIDAQGAEDFTTTYTTARDAYMQTMAIGDALAEAIVMQFPELFAE